MARVYNRALHQEILGNHLGGNIVAPTRPPVHAGKPGGEFVGGPGGYSAASPPMTAIISDPAPKGGEFVGGPGGYTKTRPPMYANPVTRPAQSVLSAHHAQQMANANQMRQQVVDGYGNLRYGQQPSLSPQAMQNAYRSQQQNIMQNFRPFAQQMATQDRRALQDVAFSSRPPMFSQNFAGVYDQMRAAQQGAMNTMRGRRRPFSNYYAGQRQGRGGAQPVASPEDAARRQQMQEMAARRNMYANQIGDRRGRTLQRRNVFA